MPLRNLSDHPDIFSEREHVGSCEEILNNILKDNRAFDKAFSNRFFSEIVQFFQFATTMIWAFPMALYMRRHIRKNKQLNHILQFKELLQVRNNIEKGSFAYDTLLFRQSPMQLLKNKTHLANMVCLAILFGDEFIDGVATEYGKQNIQTVLANPDVNYYLRCKNISNKYELYYEFDICDVLPKNVLESVNEKYGITYKAFYDHLQFLLSEMNFHLNKVKKEKAEPVAILITKACNKCFDTYKADINEFNEDYSLIDLMQYQKTKDDDIIQLLLTLRAVLLNKKQLQYQKQFGSWSSMVRSMQLYDDMQDVAGDCNFQMNTICYFAKMYFENEWLWLQKNKLSLQHLKGLALHATISINMPASCIMLMQYARNIASAKLNWVQRKIQNYLWLKNWLGFNNILLSDKNFCFSSIMNKKDVSIPFKLHYIKLQIMQIDHSMITEDMKWAHIVDVLLMDDELKMYLFKKITFKEKYFLKSCFVELPIKQKAALAKQLF